MTSTRKSKGPFLYRALVLLLSVTLSVLFVWLLGFVLEDIDDLDGPSYPAIERRFVSPEDEALLAELEARSREVTRKIEIQAENQLILRKSTENSRSTMNQLLEIHRLNLEKGVQPTPEAQAALAEAERLFLANQSKYEEANERIASLSEEERDLERRIDTAKEELENQREPARAEHRALQRAHEFKVAALKLAFLLPLFLVSAWLVFKRRKSPYRPIFHAALAATSWKVGTVMHEHFPSEVFKYLVIAASIAIVLLALLKVIGMIVKPRRDWLLKQYREAYRRHRCPVCSDPILRGPFRHAIWTRKGPILAHEPRDPDRNEADEKDYVCPACGVKLFEACAVCESPRHSLLPYCQSCGAREEPEPDREPEPVA